MIQRPKPGESEDELLRMQEEFLQEKSNNQTYQPAAQVINLHKTEPTKRPINSDMGARIPSKYAQSKGLKTLTEKRPRTDASTSSLMGDILEKNLEKPPKESKLKMENDQVYFPVVIPSLLGNIVEKYVDVYNDFDVHHTMPSEGFPEVTKRDPTISSSKKSIHRQHWDRMKQNEVDMDIESNTNSKTKSLEKLLTKSYIITSQEANDIHNENIKLLKSLSEQEILEEQKKLFATLDPNLVEFIKTRRQEKAGVIQGTTTFNNKENSDEMDTSEPIPEQLSLTEPNIASLKAGTTLTTNNPQCDMWDNDVLSHPDVSNWLHCDSLENDKLEWMKGIQENIKDNPDQPYEARFDFKGYLLPYTMEYTEKTKTLFHHGEEPHRPGYSIKELIELSRSAITQQRIMALSIIAGILEYYSAGSYKDVIELPLSKLFFAIRIAMDENKIPILEQALKAMRNLFYNRIDEASLDALIGFDEGTVQPCLENDKSEIIELDSKEEDFKDFHLAEIDLVAAILRTEILQRLYYILEVVRPSFNCVQYALQILTRLARDSVDTSMKIVKTEHLMNTIIGNFLPTTMINFRFDPQIIYKGKPVLAAVRLFRILCLQSREIGNFLVTNYDILTPISEYISSGVDATYGLRIQIESYCLLSNLLTYRIGIENAISIFSIITTCLYKHVHGTDIFATSSIISATHAAVVVQFIKRLLSCNLAGLDNNKTQIYPLLKDGVQKWIKQLSQAETYTCAHMRLLCSVLDCIRTILIIENYPIKFLNDCLHQLFSSPGFKEMVKNIIPSSNLLSGLEEKDLNLTKNLMSLGGSVIQSAQKVLPILNVVSPLPFLASLFKLLTHLEDKVLIESFLYPLTPYLNKLSKKPPSLSNNWFTRMEIDLIFNILKLSIQTNPCESDKDLLYVVANKLCYILRIDKRHELDFVFNKIVFNKDWFTAERMLNLMNISDEAFLTVLTSIDDIKVCYSRVININYIDSGPNVYLLKWREPILPRDWIYLPILMLYSKSQEVNPVPEVTGDHAKKVALHMAKEKELIITCSLEWILFNELCFPELLNDIDVTDRFCRIMCVFLCDNSLFLDSKIKLLLQKSVQCLFKKKVEFNFDKLLVGLHNFQDFYTQLLEQFQSVSYGDHTFAACILVPLAQKHNVKWRKLIWSEYAGCLRALDCPEELLCYEINDYLYPEEKDESLIKSYFRALSCNLLRTNTVAYKIAQHHVDCFKTRQVVYS